MTTTTTITITTTLTAYEGQIAESSAPLPAGAPYPVPPCEFLAQRSSQLPAVANLMVPGISLLFDMHLYKYLSIHASIHALTAFKAVRALARRDYIPRALPFFYPRAIRDREIHRWVALEYYYYLLLTTTTTAYYYYYY